MSQSDPTSPLSALAPSLQTELAPAWPCASSLGPARLMSASLFPWEALTHAYNQTRIDYIVPMPMNIARLRDYVRIYDVDMSASLVALHENQIAGLAMLGVRPAHCWATRLGVLPVTRQRHIGQMLMEALIEQSLARKSEYIVLEVIKGNQPAYRLFKKLGFGEVRELLIMRRPPGLPLMEQCVIPPYTACALGHRQAIDLLQRYRGVPSWLNEPRSLENAGNIAALEVTVHDGGHGWIVYQNTVFQLGRLVLQTEDGDPREVGRALLHALHMRHPAQDTNTENIPADDPHLPAMYDLGYLESFRRIEMRLELRI